MMPENEHVILPVRRVVELVLRGGSIDSRFSDPAVMHEGSKAHRKLQKAVGGNYQSEVHLTLDTFAGGIPVTLTGRADGIITHSDDAPEGVVIDEIKTTALPLHKLYEQRALHFGQAKCYAHMWLKSQPSPPDTVTIQLTYHQLETQETEYHRETCTADELAAFVEKLLSDYAVWLTRARDWKLVRNTSIKALNFPFEAYRRGQREMSVAAYRAIESGRKLYVQAPTGIGKTLSALFPSIKAVGQEKAGRLFYLTAKTVTREVAENALSLMHDCGLRLKSVTLRAKDKICFCGETICTPEYCEYADGHFDRVNNALVSLLDGPDLITPSVVEDTARKFRVCPFELSLDAALYTDTVICDYNHIFDPVAYMRRFFEGGASDDDCVFLIDEAHNLAERVRDMYSAELYKSSFNHLTRLKDKTSHAKALRRTANKLNAYFVSMRNDLISDGGASSRVTESPDAVLTGLVEHFAESAGDWLKAEPAHLMQSDVLSLYFEALSYLSIAELYDGHYRAITEIPDGDVRVTLFCVDPSEIIAKRLQLARASVLFSATLTPLGYYRDVLGGDEHDLLLTLPSPYDADRLLLAAHHGISTKYTVRRRSFLPISDAIYAAISGKPGNYIVYFPSYEYMRQVYEVFFENHPDVETIVQDSGMDEDARIKFLRRFDANNEDSLLGFCVLGGVFSEGIDLRGNRLIGTVIVGVGLPGLSLRQELIREYYDRQSGAGYDYAYVFPGMNKVLQAAGRVIRGESDFGLILLIDSRYATRKYCTLFPAHWSHIRFIEDSGSLTGMLREFPYFDH